MYRSKKKVVSATDRDTEQAHLKRYEEAEVLYKEAAIVRRIERSKTAKPALSTERVATRRTRKGEIDKPLKSATGGPIRPDATKDIPSIDTGGNALVPAPALTAAERTAQEILHVPAKAGSTPRKPIGVGLADKMTFGGRLPVIQAEIAIEPKKTVTAVKPTASNIETAEDRNLSSLSAFVRSEFGAAIDFKKLIVLPPFKRLIQQLIENIQQKSIVDQANRLLSFLTGTSAHAEVINLFKCADGVGVVRRDGQAYLQRLPPKGQRRPLVNDVEDKPSLDILDSPLRLPGSPFTGKRGR